MQEELIEVDIQAIKENPFQPRRAFSQAELQELAVSIQAVGLLHPPLVRPVEGGYELISGERRFRACQLLGMQRVPVVVKRVENAHSAEAALIENIQRVDLNALEIAKALQLLIRDFGLNHDELAQRMGKNRSTISNYLRILGLPRNIQEGIRNNLITLGHAKAILSLDGFEKQNLLFELIMRDELSVREAEETAARIADRARKQKLVYANRDFFLDQLAEKIQEKLGTKVSIYGKGKKGRIVIDYYNLDDLDRLLAMWGVKQD